MTEAPTVGTALTKTDVMVEYILRDTSDGEFYIDIQIERTPYDTIGPFATASDRQRAHDDLLKMARALGGEDMPLATN